MKRWYLDTDFERVRVVPRDHVASSLVEPVVLEKWMRDPAALATLLSVAQAVAPSLEAPRGPDDVDGLRRLRDALLSAVAAGALLVEPQGSTDGALARLPKATGSPASLGPPQADPNEDPTGWFEVTVIDPWGEPIGELNLEISYAGTRKKLTTPANGRVRVEKVGASFGSARILDIPAARALVRPRFLEKPPTTPPAVPNPTQVALTDDLDTVPLTSEVPKTIVVVKPLTRVRLLGTHFDTNKSFMRSSAVRGIRLLVAEAERSPKGNVLIVGHTDSVGPEEENLGLSVDRAESVQAYLKNDVKAWEAWFSESKLQKTRWGNLEIAQMISALPCDQSVAGFQQWSNENKGTSLVVDGKPGELTRRALIRAYMELGGTTLPAGMGLAVHGCGEFFPAEDVGDGVADEENRRVEMLCFDDAINPPVPGKRAKKGEKEYPQWREQVTKNVDVGAKKIVTVDVRLTGPDLQPIPHAPCRLRARRHVVLHADEGGWVNFELESGDASTILEWDTPAFPDRFGYCRALDAAEPGGTDDEAGMRRLRHLSSVGDTLEELVSDYQSSFQQKVTGRIADIRDQLTKWHDGGPKPPPASTPG